jgi:hypothetical protein
MPETKGTVDRFLLNQHGEADGLLLKHGMEVHFPPHMSAQIVTTLKPGAEVKIHGVRPRGAEMITAVSLETADGTLIIDQGPPKKDGDPTGMKEHAPDARKPMDVEGVVRRILHGPKGEKRGALLEDGRIVQMPPHTAESLHDKLGPGHKLAARGESLTNALGTVVAAKEIGVSLSALHPVELNKPGEHVGHKPARPDEQSKKPEPAM